MNSPKPLDTRDALDAALSRELSNWASNQRPARDRRARLLHMAFHMRQDKFVSRRGSVDALLRLDKRRRGQQGQGSRLDALWNLYDRYELTVCRIV